MSIFADLVFGALQGATEFLPISSSGHLVIFHEVLGISSGDDLAFDAILQLGTMLALLVYFRQDIFSLAKNTLHWLSRKKTAEITRDAHLVFALGLGTIPALIVGLLLQKWMETQFRHAWLVAIVLILGSALMAFAESLSTKQTKKDPSIGIFTGLKIGLFQCLALVPGMSRSGSTISGGLILGLSREQATRFSFLLSIPIITGSGLLKLLDLAKSPSLTYGTADIAVGFLASFCVGYAAIAWLLKYLKTHSLYPFIWYRLGLAAIVLVWSFTR